MTNPLLVGRHAVRALTRATGMTTAGLCLLPAAAMPALADGAVWPLPLVAQAPAAGSPPPAAEPNLSTSFDIEVVAKALNQARINIEPKIGASTYTLSNSAIQDLPSGSNTPINDAILQMPGVDQDSVADGGIHVRNEHLNVQYRIDGVIIPDGVSFFGQDLSTRFVDSMQLITGALPAEYGLRTAGIVDIQSKSGLFTPGGSITLSGGSYATINPSLEYGGSVDGYNYYFSGDYLDTDHGVNNVTSSYNPIHDHSEQTHDFAYLDKIIDANNKVSVIRKRTQAEGAENIPTFSCRRSMPACNPPKRTNNTRRGAEVYARIP